MNSSVSTALARFQDAFSCALLRPDAQDSAEVAAFSAQPGFAVYRNTVMKRCVDALEANYPAVARLVGEEWFRAAATIYVRERPPADPVLLYYGEHFPQFLRSFEPAAALPYLPAVAQLDRCWTESHCAPDAMTLDAADVARRSPEALGGTALRVHPAARWAWFADAPIYTIWCRNREEKYLSDDLEWRGEGVLLTRPRDAVRWTPLDAAGCAFLDACAGGAPLGRAAEAALHVRQDSDLAGLMRILLETGAFCDMCTNHEHETTEERP